MIGCDAPQKLELSHLCLNEVSSLRNATLVAESPIIRRRGEAVNIKRACAITASTTWKVGLPTAVVQHLALRHGLMSDA